MYVPHSTSSLALHCKSKEFGSPKALGTRVPITERLSLFKSVDDFNGDKEKLLKGEILVQYDQLLAYYRGYLQEEKAKQWVRCSRSEDAKGAKNTRHHGDRKPFNDNAPRPELMKQVVKHIFINLKIDMEQSIFYLLFL